MLARPPQADDSGVLDSVHFVKRALQEQVYYPEHASRSESSLYAAQHHRLVHSLDSPCLVCGVRNTTLADPRQNKVHAQQMETHHAVIEWALQNAIDVDKFNAQVVLPRRKLGMNKPRYDHDFSEAQMKAWIDHDSDNLIVLCDVHHRHTLVGIHSVTYPIWNVQSLIRDDFQLTPYALHRIESVEARHEAAENDAELS